MIKVSDGCSEISGTSEEVTLDLVSFLIAINESHELQKLLADAEAKIERLVKEGRYVPDNSSNKS